MVLIEFCKKCGGLLIPKKAGKKVILVCRACSWKGVTKLKKEFKLSVSEQKPTKEILVVDKKSRVDILPKTQVQCPKCENREAFWWMQQTRSADEPATRFFRCTKCGYTWREYE